MRRRRNRSKCIEAVPAPAAISEPAPRSGGASWAGPNGGLYPSSPDTEKRGWRPRLDRDVARLIPRYKHRAMLSDGRHVYAGIGQVSGAVHDKANFVVGSAWIPRYLGTNSEFKAAFAEVMRLWLPTCDLRGQPYDWQRVCWLTSKSLDTDGEVFIALTASENGRPRIQCLESHRIGSPGYAEAVPADVAGYAGRRVIDGIVFDEAMRPIAYNLLPTDAAPYDEPKWNLVPAHAIQHVYDPRWFSQARGIPTLCNGILDWYDIGEIRDAEKTGVKAAARIALLEYNETGRLDPGPALMAARTAGDPTKVDVHHKLIESGLIRYFKAGNGNKLEAFASGRPGATWEGFMDHLGRSAHRGMDWPIEMHDMSKLGGASVRAVVGQVQRAVNQRQDALWHPLLGCVLYAVSVCIVRGDLPAVPDWWDITFSLPPKFSVDVGRDAENRRQDVAMGLRGVDDVFGEEGEADPDAVFRRRAKIWKLRDEIAQSEGVPPEAIFNPAAASQPALITLGTRRTRDESAPES